MIIAVINAILAIAYGSLKNSRNDVPLNHSFILHGSLETTNGQ